MIGIHTCQVYQESICKSQPKWKSDRGIAEESYDVRVRIAQHSPLRGLKQQQHYECWTFCFDNYRHYTILKWAIGLIFTKILLVTQKTKNKSQ